MKEVSCKALSGFLNNLDRNRIPMDRFIGGTGCSLKHLRSKHERIDWAEFVALMPRG